MPEREHSQRAFFGFWIYLMTDLIMFAGLFAAYLVLRNNTFGGPGAKDLFSLRLALAETLILLTSSFSCGVAIWAMHRKDKIQTLIWLGVTFALGASFLILELKEFMRLVSDGHTWQKSAFLSSFFTLVGTHGLHIFVGLFLILISMILVGIFGLNEKVTSQLVRLGLFWHFLDIVWIFIFTIVYILGVARV